MQIILAALALLYPFILAKKQKTTLIMEESVDLSKDGVTQKPREWPIRRDEVQWTAMSISFKRPEKVKARVRCRENFKGADGCCGVPL